MGSMNGYIPIDTRAITLDALRGSGPGNAVPERKRYRWLRRQPTERPRSTPVSPASSRARASARSVPSSAR
jgi:hypothetical protein